MKNIKIISLSIFLISLMMFFSYVNRYNQFQEVVDQYARTISHIGAINSSIRSELKKKYDINVTCLNSCSAYVGESITVTFTKTNYFFNSFIAMNIMSSERYIIMGLLY